MTLCAGCFITAGAQSSFTQRLQQSNQGEGKVTVKQSKEIDELVNGSSKTTSTTTPRKQEKDKADNPSATKQEKPLAKVQTGKRDSTDVYGTDDSTKKITKGQKVNGYRVQVFAGGNSRNDRIKAERIGSEIRSLFPGEPVYVHFYSPRWICRMGNYRSYEEAYEILSRVKNLGYQSAIVVKGKITVHNP